MCCNPFYGKDDNVATDHDYNNLCIATYTFLWQVSI